MEDFAFKGFMDDGDFISCIEILRTTPLQLDGLHSCLKTHLANNDWSFHPPPGVVRRTF